MLLVKCNDCSNGGQEQRVVTGHKFLRSAVKKTTSIFRRASVKGTCRSCGDQWSPNHSYRHDLKEISLRLKRLEKYYEES